MGARGTRALDAGDRGPLTQEAIENRRRGRPVADAVAPFGPSPSRPRTTSAAASNEGAMRGEKGKRTPPRPCSRAAFRQPARSPNPGRVVRDRRFGDRRYRVEQHAIL
ncbi:MAG: hypothetical protein AVDCRST_MAG19-3134 [uncultured Thermomicrobiales bacterium]|uniref:Uncharacterized protein n=1 Tax=uncultured Thermomicrobiales bacterium TaxID=1645740 RepID=A0A6J4VD72_9BACT|nr:MAG: hypothetical protein AVDCRST_MAG19-3134 [uncultured Thermomicrobiales bacterium]